MMLVAILIWEIFMHTEGVNAQKDFCGPPDIAYSADIYIDRYVVDSRVYYSCDANYSREPGAVPHFRCSNLSGHIDWICLGNRVTFKCTSDQEDITLPPNTMKNTRATGADSLHGEQETESSTLEGYCSPKHIKHAAIDIKKGRYAVGQEVRYRCDPACTDWPDTSGVMKCVHCHGRTFWDSASRECTKNPGDLPSSTAAAQPSVTSYFGIIGSITIVAAGFLSLT